MIEETKTYKVGSRIFPTKEAAEEFVDQEEKQNKLIQENIEKLKQYGKPYVPVKVGDDLEIFYHNGERHYPYESVFNSISIRYQEEVIDILSEKVWLEQFVEEKMNHIVYVKDFSIVLAAFVQFNIGNHVDSYKLLEAISHFQFQPEVIYD